MTVDTRENLSAKINLETSRIAWSELQRFFAAGTAVYVAADLDLIEVATRIAEDDKAQVESWMRQGLVGQVSDEQAHAWFEGDAELWAVVVKPWVLVQPAD
jgi:hypothetical protein